jgi:hypothetical protein
MRRALIFASVCAALAIVNRSALDAQDSQKPEIPIRHESGQNVAPVYEGWFRDPDGTLNLSFGYLNRNYTQTLDIPIGPDNKIEPGPPDQGQPTHFVARRQWGIFTVNVSNALEKKLLDEMKTVSWTLTAYGQTVTIPANMGPKYSIDALWEATADNTPPALRFDPAASPGRGPRGISTTLTTVVGRPVPLTLWIADDRHVAPQRQRIGEAPVKLIWSKYRGPAPVRFADDTPDVKSPGAAGEKAPFSGKSTTTATFSQPGEYTLRVEAMDLSDHSFHCCWTNAYVKVRVSPAAGQTP